MNINGKKAIVFGGTSGIGLSATQMLSDKGAHVVAISRNPEKLGNLPKNVTTYKLNVLDREAIEKFFQDQGFEVLDIKGLNLGNNIEFGKITPEYLKQFALSIDQQEADAIFLSCSGIRALDIVEEVETITGKPVITSNQGQMWHALRTAGITDKINGFGRIFNF